jgi:hypothetical protein
MPKGVIFPKNLKLCKYAEVYSYRDPIICKAKPKRYMSCPSDSGANRKCDRKCYEYTID